MSNQRASRCSWLSLLFVPFSHPTVRSPAGKPSQISSQSYRQTAPGGGDVSGSMLKLSNSTTISDILGAKIMKVQSRLLGYFSGKPGVSMVPLGAVKFLEHSGPARTEDSWVFGQTDLFWHRQRREHCRGQRSGQILLSFHIKVQQDRTLNRGLETKKKTCSGMGRTSLRQTVRVNANTLGVLVLPGQMWPERTHERTQIKWKRTPTQSREDPSLLTQVASLKKETW